MYSTGDNDLHKSKFFFFADWRGSGLEAWDRNVNFGGGRLVGEAETTHSMGLPHASEFAFFRLV